MAELPRGLVDSLNGDVSSLADSARGAFERRFSAMLPGFLDERGLVPPDRVADLRDAAIGLMDEVAGAAAEASCARGAMFYDEVRTACAGKALGHSPSPHRRVEHDEDAIRGMIDSVDGTGDPSAFAESCAQRVDYSVRRACGDAVADCGRADPLKPKFARVPAGAETCGFCIMLASRGAVYASELTAGALNHYHANCDCKVVPDFGDGIEGYDPVVYYNQYVGMLEGYELEPHLDLMPRHGRNTSRIYQTASHDYSKAFGIKKKSGRSAKYRAEANGLKFDSFDDVRKFLYASTSQEDLEHRYSQLGGIWGFKSEQMQSQAMLNAVRHVEKRIGHPFEGGAPIGKARISHGGAISRRDLLSNIQIGLNIENPRVTPGVTRLNVGDYISGLYGEPSPMEFELADGGRCNPHYGEDDAFGRNCPITLAVYEYRRRGFNVSAKGWSENLTDITDDPSSIWLSSDGESVWSDGLIGYTEEEAIDFVSSRIGVGQRFGFAFHGHDRFGHVVSIERCEDGDLLVYDTQSGDYFKGKSAEDFISGTADIGGLFRIDDAHLAPGIAEEWMDFGFDETVY